MIEIRVLTPDDWTSWRDLRLAALTDAPYAFGSRLADWQGDGDREERWRSRLAIPGSHNLLADLDGRPVGMVSGVPTPTAGTAELISMFLRPDARGRGVGDALVEAVAQWARRSGADRLRLAVVPGNKAAVRLYERQGFVATDELGDLMPDGVHREQIMVKQLA
ncbi:GNAT family N-acetyltransferase [Micromonospora costi]|uniref:GNAT family N-acetyltransferase n=1 Tax=Micromonospora costi TaxID=1530042 RepID=UPI0034061E02